MGQKKPVGTSHQCCGKVKAYCDSRCMVFKGWFWTKSECFRGWWYWHQSQFTYYRISLVKEPSCAGLTKQLNSFIMMEYWRRKDRGVSKKPKYRNREKNDHQTTPCTADGEERKVRNETWQAFQTDEWYSRILARKGNDSFSIVSLWLL